VSLSVPIGTRTSPRRVQAESPASGAAHDIRSVGAHEAEGSPPRGTARAGVEGLHYLMIRAGGVYHESHVISIVFNRFQ
jgi:hypothetical protein